jgi:hypothetical protein
MCESVVCAYSPQFVFISTTECASAIARTKQTESTSFVSVSVPSMSKIASLTESSHMPPSQALPFYSTPGVCRIASPSGYTSGKIACLLVKKNSLDAEKYLVA